MSRNFAFKVPELAGFVAIVFASMLALSAAAPVSAQTVTLHGTVAPDATRLSPVGRADSDKVLTMAITRMPRNQAEVNALIAAQQDPNSPHYHKWLTPDEYTKRFGPTEHDFNAVADWLKSSGFQVTADRGEKG